ncbi:MAG: hypothetical protein ACJAY7_001379 [Pseudohongiellaceae bacterium]
MEQYKSRKLLIQINRDSFVSVKVAALSSPLNASSSKGIAVRQPSLEYLELPNSAIPLNTASQPPPAKPNPFFEKIKYYLFQ